MTDIRQMDLKNDFGVNIHYLKFTWKLSVRFIASILEFSFSILFPKTALSIDSFLFTDYRW